MNRPQCVGQGGGRTDETSTDPDGRQEQWDDSPEGWPQDPTMSWLRPTTSTDRKGLR